MMTAPPPQIASPDEGAMARALERLHAGLPVAFPTETVYGLGADATVDRAVAGLYALKGRPQFNPLISHIPGLEEALALGVFSSLALLLAEAFWPGPMTLVVRRAQGCPVSHLATAGLDTIALRVPAHGLARALLLAFGRPLVAPSANRSGHVSPTSAAHVAADFQDTDLFILDGGATALGLESTVIDASGAAPRLLRPGALARADIEARIGPLAGAAASGGAKPVSPGQLASHYAPRAPLRLGAVETSADETLIAFGPPPPGTQGRVLQLSQTRDLTEAAANLFALLRLADAAGPRCIAVMPIPETGLGEAINDRLARAAAPRPPTSSDNG